MSDQPKDDGLNQWSPKALRGEVRRLRRLLTAQLSLGADMEVEAVLNVKGEPFVQIRWGEQLAQLDTEQARRHGAIFFDCAAACEYDADLMKALYAADTRPEDAHALLQAIREQRTGDINASLRRRDELPRVKAPPPPPRKR